MFVATRQSNASSAAAAWLDQYKDQTKPTIGGDPQDTLKRLVALGHAPSPESVDEVIGNRSWTEVRCKECEEVVESAVVVGYHCPFDSEHDSTALICKRCLQKALDLLEASTPEIVETA